MNRNVDLVASSKSKHKSSSQLPPDASEDDYEQDFEDSGPVNQVDDYSEDDEHVTEGVFTAEELLTRAQIRSLIDQSSQAI